MGYPALCPGVPETKKEKEKKEGYYKVIYIYHIIYKSSNRNKVHDKFGIMYFENRITMQIRSRD